MYKQFYTHFTPHIRPGDGGAECTDGVPVTVTVNINPRPRIAVITDAELCYDNPASFDVTNPNTVNSGAIWYYDISPVIYPQVSQATGQQVLLTRQQQGLQH